jgi:hypothetical protein
MRTYEDLLGAWDDAIEKAYQMPEEEDRTWVIDILEKDLYKVWTEDHDTQKQEIEKWKTKFQEKEIELERVFKVLEEE